MTRMASHSIAQQGIARTYQTAQLFPNMTVLDNVLIALRRGRLGAGTIFSRGRDLDHQELAESLLAFVGYRGPLRQLPRAWPHVDKRLVQFARALATQPSACALGEPPAGLPP